MTYLQYADIETHWFDLTAVLQSYLLKLTGQPGHPGPSKSKAADLLAV